MASSRATDMPFVRQGGPPNSDNPRLLTLLFGSRACGSVTVHLLHYSEAGEPVGGRQKRTVANVSNGVESISSQTGSGWRQSAITGQSPPTRDFSESRHSRRPLRCIVAPRASRDFDAAHLQLIHHGAGATRFSAAFSSGKFIVRRSAAYRGPPRSRTTTTSQRYRARPPSRFRYSRSNGVAPIHSARATK
jgi:hypothetical protein